MRLMTARIQEAKLRKMKEHSPRGRERWFGTPLGRSARDFQKKRRRKRMKRTPRMMRWRERIRFGRLRDCKYVAKEATQSSFPSTMSKNPQDSQCRWGASGNACRNLENCPRCGWGGQICRKQSLFAGFSKVFKNTLTVSKLEVVGKWTVGRILRRGRYHKCLGRSEVKGELDGNSQTTRDFQAVL